MTEERSGGGSGEDDDGLNVDEQELLEEYRLLNWTRLIQIDNWEADQNRKWPIGPDIVEECQAVAELEADES